MRPCRLPCWSPTLASAALVVLLLTAGCATTYDVSVDAINHPKKVAGISYRITTTQPRPAADQRQHAMVLATVRTAFSGRGMFETPDRGQPDILIEVDYGVKPPRPGTGGGPVMAGGGLDYVHDIFLNISAREFLPRGARPKGEELWSVNLSVESRRPALEPMLPVLGAAMMDYIDANSHTEKIIVVRPDSPDLAFVKQGIAEKLPPGAR